MSPMPPPPPGMPPPPPPSPSGYGTGYGTGFGLPVTVSPYGDLSQRQYASWFARIAATFLDGIIAIPVAIPGAVLLGLSFVNGHDGTCRNGDGLDSTCRIPNVPILVAGIAAIMIGNIAYSIWYYRRLGRTGQSIGRKALGYRVVDKTTGQPIGAWKAFGRDLLHILDALPCYLGYFWPLWDKENQTLSDKAINTVAVKA